MNRREFLTTASAAAIAPAIPMSNTPAQVGLDMARVRDVGRYIVITNPHRDGWVWTAFDEQPKA